MKIRTGLLCASLLTLASFAAHAGDDPLAKTLKGLEGKTATVVLVSGTELTGKVGSVTDDTVKLSELSGKEFFDSVVNLDHVQAVVYRAK